MDQNGFSANSAFAVLSSLSAFVPPYTESSFFSITVHESFTPLSHRFSILQLHASPWTCIVFGPQILPSVEQGELTLAAGQVVAPNVGKYAEHTSGRKASPFQLAFYQNTSTSTQGSAEGKRATAASHDCCFGQSNLVETPRKCVLGCLLRWILTRQYLIVS